MTFLCSIPCFFPFPFLFQYKKAIIRDEDGGEREGYDEADESQQVAPHGEGEEDDGRAQSHHLTHNTRREHQVLNALYYQEDDEAVEDDEPEVLTRLVGTHQSQKHGRDDAQHLEVRHEVEYANEHAQGYCQRHAHDTEADGKQDTHKEGYE